jgi:hypothetical protein
MSTDYDKGNCPEFPRVGFRKDNIPGTLPHYVLTVFEDTQSTLPNPGSNLVVIIPSVASPKSDTSRPRGPTIQPISVCI